MKKLFFACLLAAMVSPAFSIKYTKPQYCECIGIGMPEASSALSTYKSGHHNGKLEILFLRIQLWGYLYGF